MPELHVRNLPPDLHRRLREQASAEGRSMSAEAIVLLRRGLQNADNRAARQQDAIDRLRRLRERRRLSESRPPAEQLVREDRDTAP